jgi:HNH endonuclease
MTKHLGLCVICGSEFIRFRPLRGQTCSPRCRANLRRRLYAEWMPEFPIGTVRTRRCKGGYVYKFRKIGKGNKWAAEQRCVYQDAHGPIPPGMHIHHLNSNTLDNRLENLRLVSADEHSRVHHMLVGWSKYFDQCKECGTIKRKHRAFGLCIQCYAKQWYRHRVTSRILANCPVALAEVAVDRKPGTESQTPQRAGPELYRSAHRRRAYRQTQPE